MAFRHTDKASNIVIKIARKRAIRNGQEATKNQAPKTHTGKNKQTRKKHRQANQTGQCLGKMHKEQVSLCHIRPAKNAVQSTNMVKKQEDFLAGQHKKSLTRAPAAAIKQSVERK